VLVIFGPKRLPELGRSMGRGMREFKDSITGKDDDDDKKPEITASQQQSPPAPHTTEVPEPTGAPTDRP